MKSGLIPRTFVAGLLLCTGCGIATRVDTIGPGFDGTRIVRMRGNMLPTPAGGAGAIELNVELVERLEQEPAFALLVEVHAELRVRSGESLRVMVEGDTIPLSRDSAATWWPRLDPTVLEQARYTCTDSLLLRMVDAEDVRVSVQGAAWREVRRLSEKNLAAIRAFVDEHVEPADSVSGAN